MPPRTQHVSNQESHFSRAICEKAWVFEKCDLVVEKIIDPEGNAFRKNDSGVNSQKALRQVREDDSNPHSAVHDSHLLPAVDILKNWLEQYLRDLGRPSREVQSVAD